MEGSGRVRCSSFLRRLARSGRAVDTQVVQHKHFLAPSISCRDVACCLVSSLALFPRGVSSRSSCFFFSFFVLFSSRPGRAFRLVVFGLLTRP